MALYDGCSRSIERDALGVGEHSANISEQSIMRRILMGVFVREGDAIEPTHWNGHNGQLPHHKDNSSLQAHEGILAARDRSRIIDGSSSSPYDLVSKEGPISGNDETNGMKFDGEGVAAAPPLMSAPP